MKREGSPLRVTGPLSDSLKGRESRGAGGKDVDCYIRLIPRDELRQPGKEGIIAQVNTWWQLSEKLSGSSSPLLNNLTVVYVSREHP